MTQTKANRLIRVPILVRIFNKETNETVTTLQSNIKTKIRNLTADALAQNADFRAEVKVIYSKSKDSWNAFECSTMKEFDHKLNPCLEMDFLRELAADGMLDKRHLEKRKR